MSAIMPNKGEIFMHEMSWGNISVAIVRDSDAYRFNIRITAVLVNSMPTKCDMNSDVAWKVSRICVWSLRGYTITATLYNCTSLRVATKGQCILLLGFFSL